MAVLVLMSQNLALSPVSATAHKRERQKYSLVHSHCVQLTLMTTFIVQTFAKYGLYQHVVFLQIMI